MPRTTLLQALALAVPVLAAAMDFPRTDDASRCLSGEHKAFQSSWTPVLISSWTFTLASFSKVQFVYKPRYTGHAYEPVDEPGSTMFKGLDLFHMADVSKGPNSVITFQRAARVYLFVNVDANQFDPSVKASLRGWTSVGWAKLVKGGETITYGIHNSLTRTMPMYAYVFQKSTGSKDHVNLPQPRFLQKKITGVSVSGIFNLWISEADGSPSPSVGKFNGADIAPNTVCPKALHDVWTTPNDDPNDPLPGKKFRTWHPSWDPCFWCAYGHEHGSDAERIMDYKPKFTYTAFKFNNQQESDNGFKAFVLRYQQYYVFYSLHVVPSSLRRVDVRFHTVNIAVKSRKNNELLADLQIKGDFGFAGVRLKEGKENFLGINHEERRIQQEQIDNNLPQNMRSINVINEGNLNNTFQFRSPVLQGTYEVWQTVPICSKARNAKSLLVVTLKGPNTAIKSLDQPNVLVPLGRKEGGVLFQSLGINRSLKGTNFQIGDAYCPTRADGNTRPEHFYTDPFGNTVLDGPGPNAVHQFMKKGFSLNFNGRFEVVDRWNGLHLKGGRGSFQDHGYGVDPTFN